MTTVVNTPSSNNDDGSGAGLVLGVILAIVLIAVFIIYGIPAIRQNQGEPTNTTNIIVTPPVTP